MQIYLCVLSITKVDLLTDRQGLFSLITECQPDDSFSHEND